MSYILMLVAGCIVLGQLLGRCGYKYFKLGSSATLFVGLLASYCANVWWNYDTTVPKIVFMISLIGFISAVGLMTSQTIRSVIAKYGVKFIILGLTITLIGGLSTFIAIILTKGLNAELIGTYVGALTSSPGLSTAIELASSKTVDVSQAVGLGYAISYVPGVLVVIIFAQILGAKSEKHHVEKKALEESINTFSTVKFFSVIFIGIAIGSISIQFTKSFSFSLGMTGGTLIAALLMGSMIKSYRFNPKVLTVIRDISLNSFLAIVGLNNGYSAISSIKEVGVTLLIAGLVTAVLSVGIGYIIGKYLLKIEPRILVGGICGGMTSTPGLAAAIEAFDSDEVVSGYGATYPFALIGMVIFTNILFGL